MSEGTCIYANAMLCAVLATSNGASPMYGKKMAG
jgi:hypothetical protein